MRKGRTRKTTNATKKDVKKIVTRYMDKRVEVKEYKSGILNQDINRDGTNMYNLLQIIEGVKDDQRVGDSIYLKSIHINVNFTWSNAVDQGQAIRMIVFQWMDSPAVLNNLGSVLAFVSLGGIAQPLLNVLSFYRHDSLMGKKFRILSDRTYTRGIGTTLKKIVKLNVNLKRAMKKLQYDATAGTNVLTKGGIYVGYISDQDATFPTVRHVARVHFTDF